MRNYKPLIFIITLFATLSYSCVNKEVAIKTERPNIVVIMADDLGYSDIGCYGGEIATPNLDKLANNGIRLTQFMNCSKCAPSRASLLTGLYPIEAGCNGPPAQMVNGVTIAEALKPAGYKTFMTGKWHAKETPVKRGFDHFYGSIKGGFNYFSPSKKHNFYRDDKKINPITPENKDTFYTTDEFTTQAINYLDACKDKEQPFLLYVAYNAPHYPLQAWPEDIAKYKGKYMKGWDVLRAERFKRQQDMGIVKPEWKLSHRDEDVVPWDDFDRKEDADITMATYAAMVDRVDQNIGRIVKKLKALGAFDNTLILFLSDNGSTLEGNLWDGKDPRTKPDTKNSQAKLGREWANLGNTPYRKYKRFMQNGGQLTPFIAHWPKGIKEKGAIIHERAHLVDFMPTFLELGEATYPENKKWQVANKKDLKSEWNVIPLSGKSMLPILKGEKAPKRAYFYNHFQTSRMIMKDNMKLVSGAYNGAYGYDGTFQHLYDFPWKLYDMDADPSETNNLADQYPDLVEEMDKDFREWVDYADSLNQIRQRPWFQLRLTTEQKVLAKEMSSDKKLQSLLKERKQIGFNIQEELLKMKVKIKTGLGMERVPMSYYGIVNEGREFLHKNPKIETLYKAWDKSSKKAEKYCASMGESHLQVWKIQERIRIRVPKNEAI